VARDVDGEESVDRSEPSDVVLDVRDLTKVYETVSGDVVRALDGVSFTVNAGELVAVYGPSGSGKTTLLKVLSRVLDPDAGDVLVRGVDIGALSGEDVARYRLESLGVVLQSEQLVAGVNVVGNAALRPMARGLRWKDAERLVVPLLERLDLGRELERQPFELSMGERQRVAIASALSTDPGLVLADEPTAGLDQRRAQIVLELLAEVCRERGVAVLMTTHDPRAMTVADRALMLSDGKLLDHRPESSVPTPPAPAGS
jgi:putative ABC transport system ATP-binding protein